MFRCVNVYVPNGTLTEICRTCLFPMLLKKLREEVLEANLELVRRGLVVYTFGNASGIDRSEGLVAIKPSGVPYEKLTPAPHGNFRSDRQTHRKRTAPVLGPPTHLELYRQFPNIGGVAHTHSEFATAWAQAAKPIPCFGTTHADYFHGSIPVTDQLTIDEICGDYELETGKAICRTFTKARSRFHSGGSRQWSCSLCLGPDAVSRGAQRRNS